jgi:hypothetical protein
MTAGSRTLVFPPAKGLLGQDWPLTEVHRLAPVDPAHQAVHARTLSMHNMMIRLNEQGLREFGEPDFVILNAGRFQANRITMGVDSKTSVELSLERDEMIILRHRIRGRDEEGDPHHRQLWRADCRSADHALLDD